MKILEPTTAITDYILATETFVLGFLLLRESSAQQQLAIRFFALSFFTTGIAAVAGGTFHGLIQNAVIWKITVYAIGLTSLLMLCAAAFACSSPPFRYAILVVAVLQLIVYAWWMMNHDNFKYVIWDYAPAMLVVLLLMIVSAMRGIPGAGWIIGGILISFAAAGIQQSKIELHKNFNYNDIYHIVQMAAMYVLYRGGMLLRDR